PPTPTTVGTAAGHSTPIWVCWGVFHAPKSPEEATKVTPVWPAGVVKIESYAVPAADSGEPQLIESTETPGWLRSQSTAVRRSCPPIDAAATRMMLALGATACAHSTSIACSSRA